MPQAKSVRGGFSKLSICLDLLDGDDRVLTFLEQPLADPRLLRGAAHNTASQLQRRLRVERGRGWRGSLYEKDCPLLQYRSSPVMEKKSINHLRSAAYKGRIL